MKTIITINIGIPRPKHTPKIIAVLFVLELIGEGLIPRFATVNIVKWSDVIIYD